MHSHVILVALLAVACGAASSSNLPVGTTTTTGGVSNDPGGLGVPQHLQQGPPRIVLGDDAAAQLASTHCMHEDVCGNVGPMGLFPTYGECVGAVGASQQKRLTECTKGVDPYALDRCLEDTRAEGECGASPTSCSNDRLCR